MYRGARFWQSVGLESTPKSSSMHDCKRCQILAAIFVPGIMQPRRNPAGINDPPPPGRRSPLKSMYSNSHFERGFGSSHSGRYWRLAPDDQAIRLASTPDHRLGSIIAEVSKPGWHGDCSHRRRMKTREACILVKSTTVPPTRRRTRWSRHKLNLPYS